MHVKTLLLLKTYSQRKMLSRKLGTEPQVSNKLTVYVYHQTTVPKTWRSLFQYPARSFLARPGCSGLSPATSSSKDGLYTTSFGSSFQCWTAPHCSHRPLHGICHKMETAYISCTKFLQDIRKKRQTMKNNHIFIYLV